MNNKFKFFGLLFWVLCFGVSQSTLAQNYVRDSSIRVNLIEIPFGFQLPGGDLQNRFGSNLHIGGSWLLKGKSNLLFQLQVNYLFGKDVKQDGILDSISADVGGIIDENGLIATVRLFERGWKMHTSVGYLFGGKLAKNPNSGFFVLGGVGYMWHKIKIDALGNTVPQLRGDYKKGYDRLTGGFSLNQQLGYLFLSNNQLTNFSLALECTQGFTQSLRSWNIDERKQDTQKRVDLLYGVKLAWIFPLYKRKPREYYYN